MNPPFCFDTANIRQKTDSANFYTKKMQKIAIFSLWRLKNISFALFNRKKKVATQG